MIEAVKTVAVSEYFFGEGVRTYLLQLFLIDLCWGRRNASIALRRANVPPPKIVPILRCACSTT